MTPNFAEPYETEARLKPGTTYGRTQYVVLGFSRAVRDAARLKPGTTYGSTYMPQGGSWKGPPCKTPG